MIFEYVKEQTPIPARCSSTTTGNTHMTVICNNECCARGPVVKEQKEAGLEQDCSLAVVGPSTPD